jgi:dipeptidase E
MPVDLNLFSSSGEDGLRRIVEAARPHLLKKVDPLVAYLPLASLYSERWLELNNTAFRGLARLQAVNAELMAQAEIEAVLRSAALVYIPGGNTFLLNHRLHASGVMQYLRKKIRAGLPLVGFSAGAVICGPNILTSSDLNTLGTPHFEGLNAVPFNIVPHYPDDAHGQSVTDLWLADYHFFNDNPVLLMTESAHIRVEGCKASLLQGEAWILRKSREKEHIEGNDPIVL